MLSVEQIKTVEYLATGHTIPETADELKLTPQTVRNWLKTNSEVVQELSRATDTFAKECLKSRSRSYRVIAKKITDKILEKIEKGDLDDYGIDDLIKMLDKSISAMNNDEAAKKPSLTAIQNNLNINATIKDKMKQKQFVDKFSNLLEEFQPEDIQDIVEAKIKDENSAKFESERK